MLKVNIYYGGRGLIEDPSLYVMNKLTEVLNELNIEVQKYNLYEDKQGISVLPKTLTEADGVILAASVEWLGIGGLLQQFLDACWLYGNKEKISSLYMMPVVISTTVGEKDALYTLTKAWEILGGIPCSGICAYVPEQADFETDPDYALLIEKQTEDFYRCFSKKRKTFPSSINAVCENIMPPKTIHLTPQESEQLSMYVSDMQYVKKQKEDIEELTNMFKGMLGDNEESSSEETPSAQSDDPYIQTLTSRFVPIDKLTATYSIHIQDMEKTLLIHINGKELDCSYSDRPAAHVMITTNHPVLERILAGDITLQNAFLSGEVTAKGNFKLLRIFDMLFPFTNKIN